MKRIKLFKFCSSSNLNKETIRFCSNYNIDFFNSEISFASKRSSEIVRALVVFKICSINMLVNHNKKILSWTQKVLGQYFFEILMRKTIYGHFVAGVSQDDFRDLVNINRKFGVKSILDYSAEEDIPEEKSDNISAVKTNFEISGNHKNDHVYERNVKNFINSIDASASTTIKGEGIIALKLTALCSPKLLVRISDVLKDFEKIAKILNIRDNSPFNIDLLDFQRQLNTTDVALTKENDIIKLRNAHKCTLLELFDWLDKDGLEIKVTDPKSGKIYQIERPLSKLELQCTRDLICRLNTICKYAFEKNIRIMIDAEQSYMQPTIRRITIDLMKWHNKNQCMVYNTYQCYLKEAIDNFQSDIQIALEENFHFGAKLVRGAYMDQERHRANMHGYVSPINDTYEDTTAMYYRCLDIAFGAVISRPRGEVQVMIASHNIETILHTITKFDEFKIDPQDRNVSFGQLLGMRDQISFTLGHMGYSVYKYMPYGPVSEVLPYLSRRALENRAVIEKCKDEPNLLWKELFRRLKTGTIFRYP